MLMYLLVYFGVLERICNRVNSEMAFPEYNLHVLINHMGLLVITSS